MLLRQMCHWGRAAGDKHSDSEGLYLTSWRRASTGVWPAALQRSRRPWPWGLLCRGLSQACELRGSAGTEADLGSVKRAAKAGLQSGGGGRWLGGRGGAAGALRPRFIPLGIGRAGLAGSVGGLVGTGAWLPSRPSRCCGLSMGVGAARGPMSIRRDEVKIGRARGCPAQSQRRHRVYPGHRCCPAPTKDRLHPDERWLQCMGSLAFLHLLRTAPAGADVMCSGWTCGALSSGSSSWSYVLSRATCPGPRHARSRIFVKNDINV